MDVQSYEIEIIEFLSILAMPRILSGPLSPKVTLLDFCFWSFINIEVSPIIYLEHPLSKYQRPLLALKHAYYNNINQTTLHSLVPALK